MVQNGLEMAQLAMPDDRDSCIHKKVVEVDMEDMVVYRRVTVLCL